VDQVVIIGMGQLGEELARGFRARGLEVVPVRRGDDLGEVAGRVPEPALVVVAVAEGDLHAVLGAMPPAYGDRLLLLQNELLPRDWARHGLETPTVAVVWFEKKADKPRHPILDTVVAGPRAELVASALEAIGVEVRVVPVSELPFELVAKNLYILTTNLAGLEAPVTTGELIADHRALMDEVAAEVLDLEEARLGAKLDRPRLIGRLVTAIEADPKHGSRGRTAPARLGRALEDADALGLALPRLRALAREHGGAAR
jgi:ketopantoate reductase